MALIGSYAAAATLADFPRDPHKLMRPLYGGLFVFPSVQLPVQLPCNPVQLCVRATPCLPIGELHACTRAARSPHGIGSRRTGFVLVSPSLDRYSFLGQASPRRSVPVTPDQQSRSLLAAIANAIDFIDIFALRRLSTERLGMPWEDMRNVWAP
jgi:hypothetical protein